MHLIFYSRTGWEGWGLGHQHDGGQPLAVRTPPQRCAIAKDLEELRAGTTWDAIVGYWRRLPGFVDRIEGREYSSHVAVLGDVALVYWRGHTTVEFKDSSEPIAGDSRLSAALRRTDDGWRFIHWHESRQLVAG